MEWQFLVAINLGFLIVNLIITSLNLKLYTEILKDKKQDKRVSK